MNAKELQQLLLDRYPVENERHEWKQWNSLKSSVSGRKGDDLISYVSALANMDGGCVVIGVKDRTLYPTGISDFADYTLQNLPHRVLGKCPNLPSLGFGVEELRSSDAGRVVWVVHVPRHAPRKPVFAHDKTWQREGDSLVALREERAAAILAEPMPGEDWSAVVVPGAALADLDPQALVLAREQFASKHARERWASDVPGWSEAQFLDKAKLTAHGDLTRAALLLLGRPECVAWLSPQPAEIVWKLPDERVIEAFGPPFLLATTAVMGRIRNPIIKLFPDSQLIPIQLPRYDTQLVLEALHNCIAHQDYARGERIVLEERVGRLRLANAGNFIDGQPEDYFDGSRTPRLYRNPWLAAAMNNIGMIDKGGFGIRDMLQIQRKRFLPLPDYQGSTSAQTVFNVLGRSLNEDYSRLLMEREDLDLAEVLLLDHLQKGLTLSPPQRKVLRLRGLIEGRGQRVMISARVASATGKEPEYVDAAGLEVEHFRALVLKLLKLGPQPRAKINRLLMDKLPTTIVDDARRKAFIKNLLQDMVRRRDIENVGGLTNAARWARVRQ